MLNLNRVIFACNGTLLLKIVFENVTAWTVENGQVCWQCPGIFVGLSRDDSVLLTRTQANSIQAWDTATGKPIDPKKLKAAQFEDYQRTYAIRDENHSILTLYDALQPLPQQQIAVGYADVGILHWGLTPDNQSIVVTVWGNEGGHEWAAGACINRANGQRRYTFDVDRFSDLLVQFAKKHNLLVVGSQTQVKFYEPLSGKKLQSVWLDKSSDIVAVYPKNSNLIAVQVSVFIGNEPDLRPPPQLFQPPQFRYEIHLLDLRTNEAEVWGKQTAQCVAVLNETDDLADLSFSPNGRWLASLTRVEHKVHLWDLTTKKLVQQFE